MNRTTIEWVRNPDGTQGCTWNPVTGCRYGCAYCYARRIAERFGDQNYDYDGNDHLHVSGGYRPFPYKFEPTFYPSRLEEPQKIKKPAIIFVCNMADLFGAWVPDEWIKQVLEACRKAPQHRYIFLTKNPERYGYYHTKRPDKSLWGATSEGGPLNCSSYIGLGFLSFEPLFRRVDCLLLQRIQIMKWVIVGAQTGPGAVRPQKDWVEEIIRVCRDNNVPLFLKNNLLKIYPDLPRIQEVPWCP